MPGPIETLLRMRPGPRAPRRVHREVMLADASVRTHDHPRRRPGRRPPSERRPRPIGQQVDRGRRRASRQDRPCGASAASPTRSTTKRRGHTTSSSRSRPRRADLDDVERMLRLADDVIRHKVIRLPEKEAARRGLLGEARHAGRAPGSGGALEWPTATPSPSSATSPATPSCASPHAGRPSPASASPSTAAGRTGRRNEWEEATSFFDVICWGQMAENAAESLTKGTRVIVTGRLEQRSLGDPGRREALQDRDRRRRDRPEPALGDRRGRPQRTHATAATAAAAVAAVATARRGRRRQRAARRLRHTTRSPSDGQGAPSAVKNKDNARRSKKKISILSTERVDYVDYKDVNLLRRFMSDRAKIRARRVTGNDAQQQREVAGPSRTPARWRCCPTPTASRPSAAAAGTAATVAIAATAATAVDRGDRGRVEAAARDGATADGADVESPRSRPSRPRLAEAVEAPMKLLCAPTSTASARRATSSTSPTATPATTCCPRATPSWPPPASSGQADAMRRSRDLKDATRPRVGRGDRQGRSCPRSSPSRPGPAARASCSARSPRPTSSRPSRAQTGIELDRRTLLLDEPIKTLGTHEVPAQAAHRRASSGSPSRSSPS